MAEKNYITPDGYKRLVDELTELAVVERPRVVREVSDAAAEGDRSENAAYIYGKRRLREIDRRLGFLKRRLEFVQVVKADESRTDRVFFGAWVEVEDEEGESHVYQIVGVDEVEAEKGHISWKSPIGHALIGKQIDDSFVVKWHAGQRELTVVDIRYQQSAGGEAAAAKPSDTEPTASDAAARASDAAARASDAAARASERTKSRPSEAAAAESMEAGEDEPFESDEDAERIALWRARQTAKKKPAAKAKKPSAPARPKPPAKAKAPAVDNRRRAAASEVPAAKAPARPTAEATRVATIEAAAKVKAAKKP
jgi:transcription elongation factor GreB